MAGQEACFSIVTWRSRSAKYPSSWAMRIDAQSVSAMNPSLTERFVDAPLAPGASPDAAVVSVASAPESSPPQAFRARVAPAAAAPVRKVRLSMG